MSASRIAPVATFIAGAITLAGVTGCMVIGRPGGGIIPFTEAAAAWSGAQGAAARYEITWKAPGAGNVKVQLDNKVVGQAGEIGSLSVELPRSVSDMPSRPYFELTPAKGAPLTIADRLLYLRTAPNFRDAGGYRTIDGKWVRMGLLYRSDQLDRLSPDDLERVHGLGIKLVCDLRTDVERKQGMDKLPPGATAMIADVAGGDSASNGIAKLLSSGMHAEEVLGNGRGAQIMIDANRQFVESATARLAYKAMFERLADPKMLPATIHCTAGKDRTGWGAAVFLSIMGVPREAIMQDYLMSNANLAEKNARMLTALKGRIDPALLEPLTGVRPEYLQAGFDAVDKDYGSMDRYVREGLGLSDQTIQALRNIFLTG